MCAIICGGVALAGGIDAQAGRSVGEDYGRDSEGVERKGCARSTRHEVAGGTDDGIVAGEAGHARTDDEVGFVLERHLGHHLFLVNHFLDFVGCCTTENKYSSGCND